MRGVRSAPFNTVGVALILALLTCGLTVAAPQGQKKEPEKPSSKSKTSKAQEQALENYQKACQPCHGPEGKSLLPGMELSDGEWKHGSSLEAIVKTITEGVPGTLMVANKDKFTREEIRELARLVRSFDPKFKKK